MDEFEIYREKFTKTNFMVGIIRRHPKLGGNSYNNFHSILEYNIRVVELLKLFEKIELLKDVLPEEIDHLPEYLSYCSLKKLLDKEEFSIKSVYGIDFDMSFDELEKKLLLFS